MEYSFTAAPNTSYVVDFLLGGINITSLQIQEVCATLGSMQATRYRYRYNGKEQLSSFQGRYDYGFRMYDAGVARFLSVDPLTKDFPQISGYLYAYNNPVLMIDYKGLAGDDPTKTKKDVKKASPSIKEPFKEGLKTIGRDLKHNFGTAGLAEVKQGFNEFGKALHGIATASNEENAIARDGIFMILGVATAPLSMPGTLSASGLAQGGISGLNLYNSINAGSSSMFNATQARTSTDSPPTLLPKMSEEASNIFSTLGVAYGASALFKARNAQEISKEATLLSLEFSGFYLNLKYPPQQNVPKNKER